MTRYLVGTFDIMNERNEPISADLFQGIALNNMQDFTNQWKPMFDARKAELQKEGRYTAEARREFGVEDAHWRWPEKAEIIASKGDFVGFALEAGGETQGLMICDPSGFARHESHRGMPLTRIELVSTAPWNRKQFSIPPRFRGVGRTLMSAAISLSFEEEHSGRIGLHALSGAEACYRDHCRMLDLGRDEDKQNMRYFEMTEAIARDYIS